jgi:hypothetical protein
MILQFHYEILYLQVINQNGATFPIMKYVTKPTYIFGVLFLLIFTAIGAKAQPGIDDGYQFHDNIKELPLDMLTRHRILFTASEILDKKGVFYDKNAPVLIDIYVKISNEEGSQQTDCAQQVSNIQLGDLVICMHRSNTENTRIANIDAAKGHLKLNKDGSVDLSERSIKKAVKDAVNQMMN